MFCCGCGCNFHYRNRQLCEVPEILGKCFAECDSFAKSLKYSANALPSVALGKCFAECRTRQMLCRVSHSANAFAECQRGLGTQYIGKAFFVEYFFFGIRQSRCRVPRRTRQKKNRRHGVGVKETASLSSVLGDTRQKSYLK
jgi:hypothetical protein